MPFSSIFMLLFEQSKNERKAITKIKNENMTSITMCSFNEVFRWMCEKKIQWSIFSLVAKATHEQTTYIRTLISFHLSDKYLILIRFKFKTLPNA